MAGIISNTTTKRRGLDQQATFDYSTPRLDVVAKPITTQSLQSPTPIVQPYVAKNSTLDFISKGLKTGASLYSLWDQYQKENKAKQEQEDMLAAKRDALLGKDPLSKSKTYAKTYFSLRGSIDAQGAYKRDIETFVERNVNFLDPEEFRKGLNEITQKYIEGHPDEYLDGFLPEAVSIENKASDIYHQQQLEQLKEKSFMLHKEDIKNTVEKLFANIAPKKEGEEFKLDSKVLHKALINAQTQGETLGIDKKTTSQLFLADVIKKAVSEGAPELLDFTSLKDSSGVSLDMLYGDQIEQAKMQALKTQDMWEKLKLQQEEEKKKKIKENLNKQFTFSLADIHMMPKDEALKQLSVLETSLRGMAPYLSSTDITRIEGNIQRAKDKLLEPEEFKTVETDKKVYIDFKEKEILKDLNMEDIVAAYGNDELTKADFAYFSNQYKKQEEEKEKEKAAEEASVVSEDTGSTAKKTEEKYILSQLNYIAGFLAKKDEADLDIDPTSQKEYQARLLDLYMTYKNSVEEQGGVPIYSDFVKEHLEPFLYTEGLSFKEIKVGNKQAELYYIEGRRKANFELTQDTAALDLLNTPINELENGSSAPESYSGEEKKKKGFWGWFKGLFHKKDEQKVSAEGTTSANNQAQPSLIDIAQEQGLPVALEKATQLGLDYTTQKVLATAYSLHYLSQHPGYTPYQQVQFLKQLGVPEEFLDESLSAYAYTLYNREEE
jgi:hypothetical protein